MTRTPRPGHGLTRRGLLKAGGGVVLGVGAGGLAFRLADSGIASVAGGAAGGALASSASLSGGAVREFRSRPDLHPVAVSVLTDRGGTAPGLITLGIYDSSQGQEGPMIVDTNGELVWFRPLSNHAKSGLQPFNVRVQEYRGEKVLTWFQGPTEDGFGEGVGIIVDSAYRTVREVQAGNGHKCDLHEFLITEAGTALITCHGTGAANLRGVGGPADGHYVNGIVQEVDIASGKVLFEWDCDTHVGFAESYAPAPKSSSEWWDPYHVNSINVAPDGNLIVSCRNTWTVYKVERPSGKILWRLGGKKSDFAIAPDATFQWQHDATLHPGGTLTVFDNGAGVTTVAKHSRGLRLAVDEKDRRVTLVQQYLHSPAVLAYALGSVQILPDGHVFMGWADGPYASEYLPDGRLIYDLQIDGSGARSYRAFRSAWTGRPTDDPRLAVEVVPHGMDLYVSWNGDTEVRHWKVLLGAASDSLSGEKTAARDGFETMIKVPKRARYVAVAGLDASGHELGRSAVHRVPSA